MTEKLGMNRDRVLGLFAAVLFVGLFVFCSGEAGAEPKGKSKAKVKTPAAAKQKTVDANKAIAEKVESYSITGTVDEAFGRVEKIGKVIVYVDWDGLREAGVKKTKRIAVAGTNHTLKQIIARLVTKSASRGKPLSWLIHENVVIITSQPRAMKLRKRLRDIATAPKATKQTKILEKKLEKTVAGKKHKFNFDAIPLSDVIDYFRETFKINIHVNWKALESVGVDKGTEVTLKVKDVSAGKAL
ncbi:MAG: hypothetical protein KAR11_08990, partial [Phycisphaerae bacterium]|nr:hypothetical protein [Phycisphaerae bacterium]